MIYQRSYKLQTVLPHLLLVRAMWVYIIDVDLSLYTTRNIPDDVLDDCLKRGRRTQVAKRHAVIHPDPVLGYDPAVPFAVLVQGDVVKPRLDVQGGEHSGVANGVNDILARGERVDRRVSAVIHVGHVCTCPVILPTLPLLHEDHTAGEDRRLLPKCIYLFDHPQALQTLHVLLQPLARLGGVINGLVAKGRFVSHRYFKRKLPGVPNCLLPVPEPTLPGKQLLQVAPLLLLWHQPKLNPLQPLIAYLHFFPALG